MTNCQHLPQNQSNFVSLFAVSHYKELKAFSHYRCQQDDIHAVFRPLPSDLNEETQTHSTEENTPSKPEDIKTISAITPENARSTMDIASFPDDKI